AVMLLLAAGFMTLGPQVMSWLAPQIGMEQMLVTLWTWIRWPLAILLMMLAVALIYYATPDVEQDFRFITPGSVVAVIVWLAASIGFGIYVLFIRHCSASYVSIGAIIVLPLYFSLSVAVLLLGAQLYATMVHWTAEG